MKQNRRWRYLVVAIISDDSNPFVQTAAKPKTSSASRALVWLLGVIIAALLSVLFVLWSVSQQHRERGEALRVAWGATTSDLAAAVAKLGSLQQTNADLRDRILELEKEKVLTVKLARSLEDEMRAALESKDVTISKLQGKLTVNILDRILFDSGEAVVQPDGKAVLQKIAGILKQHPELKIHGIGHTDNIPIRPGARNLDIFWLKDDALEESANLPAPEIIAADITSDL